MARILTPIVSTLDKLESLEADPDVAEYIQNQYGGIEQCRKDILCKAQKKKKRLSYLTRH